MHTREQARAMGHVVESKRRERSPRGASYKGLKPKSKTTSRIARASSRKAGTRPEIRLRQALRKLGLTFEVNVETLPGKPDVVFREARAVVFVDGDFWHGRNLTRRLASLTLGHNASYWTTKIQRNVQRDREQ